MIAEIKEAILIGDLKNIKNILNEALEKNNSVDEIFKGMTQSIKIVGDKFGNGELFFTGTYG